MKRGNYKRILSVMIMACMLTFTVSLPAVAAPEIDDRDPSAGAPPQGDYLVMKISPAANGTWTSLDGLLTVTLSNLDGNSICWSSNVAVNRVFLKFAAGGDIFDYDPPSTGLHCLSTSSGQNISHITFYYYAPSEEDPSIQLSKSGTLVLTNDYPQAGDTIDYTFIVTNNGNVTLNDIELDDPLVDVSGGPIASLAPGASDNDTFTATYTLTQDDIDAGTLTNTATVTGNFGTTTVTDDDSDEQTLKPNADIALVKTGVLDVTNASAQVGDTIDYIFTITNTGNVTLTDITLVDEDATVSGGPIASLAPGASDDTTFTAIYTLKQEDIDAGSFTNTATVTGNFGTTTATDEDSDTQTLTPNADIDLEKTGPTSVVAGSTINYTITVTNTGNVTLYNALVEDPFLGFSYEISMLQPLETETFTGTNLTYLTSNADIETGVSNEATVEASPYANEGNDSETGWVRASDTHHVQVTASPPPPTFYTLTLNVSPAGSGTATANPSQSLYSPGTQVALNATAAPGYVFTKWIIDGVEYTQQQPTITMNSNRIATAYFEPVPEPVTYTLTLNVVPPGSGTATAAPSQTAYAPGTEVVLTATEAEDFFFDKWIIDGVEYFPTQLTIVMNSNRTATAYFDEFTDIDIEPPPPEAGDEEEEEEEVMPPLPETGGSLATMYWGAGLMVLGLALKRKKQ